MGNFIPNYGPTLGALTCTLHYAKKFNLFWPSGSWENDFYMNPHYFLHLFDFLPIRTWIPFIQGYYVPSFFFFLSNWQSGSGEKDEIVKKKVYNTDADDNGWISFRKAHSALGSGKLKMKGLK